jgi:sugar lactone lactonase YvrE
MSASSKAVGLALVLAGSACAADGPVEPAMCAEPGTACVWAGIGERGFNPKDAHRLDSKLYFPQDLTFAPDGRAYIADWNNHRVRRVEADGKITVVVGTDYEGDGPPEMEDRLPLCNPAGAPGTTVAMNHMTDLEFGPDGKLYIAAWHNNKIRIWDPETGILTAIGETYGYAGDGDLACRALFNQPKAVAIAPDLTIYTIDQRNVRIREIEPGPTGRIRTIAGTGVVGNVGDGGPALEAQFGFEATTTPRPAGALVLDGRKLYIADSLNNRIRRMDLDTGIIDCIAGREDGQAGYEGDGGPALLARFDFPMDLELGPDGRLYVADRNNHVVRAIDLVSGLIETVAGSGKRCDLLRETCPDLLPAREMSFYEPYGIAFDAAGNLYVADTHNSRIVKVTR